MLKNKEKFKFELGFLLNLYEEADDHAESKNAYNDFHKFYDIFVEKWCYDDSITDCKKCFLEKDKC